MHSFCMQHQVIWCASLAAARAITSRWTPNDLVLGFLQWLMVLHKAIDYMYIHICALARIRGTRSHAPPDFLKGARANRERGQIHPFASNPRQRAHAQAAHNHLRTYTFPIRNLSLLFETKRLLLSL
jgi:hypothetical protein